MIVLDTDHLSELQYPNSVRGTRLAQRLKKNRGSEPPPTLRDWRLPSVLSGAVLNGSRPVARREPTRPDTPGNRGRPQARPRDRIRAQEAMGRRARQGFPSDAG